LAGKGVRSSIGYRRVGAGLGGSGVIELMGQAAPQAAGFGEDFFTGGLAERED